MSERSCSLSIIGDGSVGKSTIIAAFKSDGFVKVYKQTVGCDFYERKLQLRGEVYVSLRVWDIGGQSIHSNNLPTYLGHSGAIVLVYDVTNRESFANLDDWLSRARKLSSTQFIYLLGNKLDLVADRQVSAKEHERFVEDNKLAGGLFGSAKTGENVLRLFYRVAGEAVGVKLTEYELAFHDKVLTAHITANEGRDGARNEWADDIEREDREAERRKNSSFGCDCCLS
ncbi:P-loop containing nucleoside triphosphate hydrolase protein [Ochromonadaceae sp. CCMP2298]|nr:P-loop containing nucleoside triphosphate hydrolase protein [Ochromonadaceae sp. CCMP2298]|mmetsp:Transcript_7843/g.17089  ORF Transcript_7843/g.17089 Transcript_7843/m.17089 type:complete len:228 (+) Transcript_7843:120-803(+)